MTEVQSPVLKLKADNNPWNCDCAMKDLFDIIFKRGVTLPNLICKGPSEYENKHWGVLKYADCSTTVAPPVTRMTEKSVSVSVTSSSDRKAAILKDTEKTAANNVSPLPDTGSVEMTKVIIISVAVNVSILLVVICLFYVIYVRILKRRTRRSTANEIGMNSVPLINIPLPGNH
jgi:hypothetical protein